MKRFWISCAAVAALGWVAWGQRVETERPNQGKIVHVQTALDHLTVLEMSEAVSAVAVGSSSFRVEWRGNKIFIEPTEPHVATNLFVWTPSGRFNYELDPAGTVPQMVFAIDQSTPNPPKIRVARARTVKPVDPSPADVLLATRPVRLHGPISRKDRVAVYITNLLDRNGELLICYSVRNRTNSVYVPGIPQVVALAGPRYRQSLYSLEGYQLGSGEAPGLKSSGEIPIAVTRSEMEFLQIEPGQAATGIVAVELPPEHTEPLVIRLIFLRGSTGPVGATVVL